MTPPPHRITPCRRSLAETLLRQPWVGASWEGFVIDQALTALQQAGRRWQAHHLHTADQREIDLLLEVDSELWALEIKLTARPGPQDLARLNANADLVDADRRFVVCQRSERMENETQVVCDLAGLMECICHPEPCSPAS